MSLFNRNYDSIQSGEQKNKVLELIEHAKKIESVLSTLESSRLKSIALTNLEGAMMWAVKSIMNPDVVNP